MIRFLQTKGPVQRVLLVGFLLLICIAMGAYLIPGINDTLMGGSSNDVVAKIGNHVLTTEDVNRAVTRVMRQNRYPEQYRGMLANRVAEELMMQQVELWQAEQLGLGTTDEELRSNLRRIPQIYPDGKFIGQQAYTALLSENNTTVPLFEKQSKEQLTVAKLQAVVTGGVTAGDKEVREAFIRQSTKVKFDYAVLSADSVKAGINPSDAELRAYYEKHQKELTAGVGEQRRITYAVVASNQLPNMPQASDADVAAFYKQHQAEFRVPESVTARHILIKAADSDPKPVQDAALAKATALLKQLKGGANFAALALKNSDDPGSKVRGGELGQFGRAQMVPEFSNAAFSAKVGDLVGPVKTKYGYHIIQVEKKVPAGVRTLDEVRPLLTPYVSRQKAQAALESFAQNLEKEARTSGLQKAAQAHGLQVLNSAFFTAQDQLPGVGSSQQFTEYVFGSKPGAAPSAFVTQAGVVLAQLAEVKAPQAPAFEDVKPQLTVHFRDEAASTLLQQKSKELYEKAKALNNLRAAAKLYNATVKTSELVAVTGQVPDLGQVSQIPGIVTLKKGEIAGPVSTSNSGIVIALLDHQEPGEAEIAAGKDQVKQQLLNAKREEQFGVYALDLKARLLKSGKLKFYPKHLAALTANSNND